MSTGSGPSRRQFLRLSSVLMGALALGACTGPITIEISSRPATPPPPTNGDEALKKLMAGNARYVASALSHPNQTTDRRVEVAKAQKPFAIILGCADSRVAPELLFDQGLGDLFVVRVAGNVLSDNTLGSIEYAADHLRAPLLMVLGHQKCGAVDVAVKGGEAPGQIGSLIKAIAPAVEKARGMDGDLLDNAITANVEMVVAQLLQAKPIIARMAERGELKVVGARYSLETGAVEVVGDHAEADAHGTPALAGKGSPTPGAKPGTPTTAAKPGATTPMAVKPGSATPTTAKPGAPAASGGH